MRKNKARRNNMEADALTKKRFSPQKMNKRYKSARHVTTGCVFGEDKGNTSLGPKVRDEVIRRRRAK